MSWALLVPLAFIALLTRQLFRPRAVRNVRRRWALLLHGWRWPILAQAIGLIGLVVLVAVLLSVVHPWFNVGWWSLMGGQGNVLFGSMAPDAAHASTGSASAAVAQPSAVFEPMLLLPLLIIPLLVFLAPRLVWDEELSFRKPTWYRTTAEQWRSALGFGLIHMVMGVPLAAGLALTLAGMGFTWSYQAGLAAPGAVSHEQSRRRALRAAARLHLTYNMVIMTLVFISVLLLPWAGAL